MDRPTWSPLLVGAVAAVLASGGALLLTDDPSLSIAGGFVYGPLGWLGVHHYREGGGNLEITAAPDAYAAGIFAMIGGAGTFASTFGSGIGEHVTIFLLVGGVWIAGGYSTAQVVWNQEH